MKMTICDNDGKMKLTGEDLFRSKNVFFTDGVPNLGCAEVARLQRAQIELKNQPGLIKSG